MPRQNRDHILTTDPLYEIIVEIMYKRGVDFERCNQCLDQLNGKFDLHHTKYDGATVADLEIVCRKCNLKKENKGLA